MPYEVRELPCMTQFLRWLLIGINFLFVLAAAAGIVISIITVKDQSTNYLHFCKVCQGFSNLGLAFFLALFVFSLLGFCALWKRQNCLLILYIIFLVIFFVIALILVIVVIMLHQGEFDGELSRAWSDEATNNPTGLCKFQLDVNCTGWDTSCVYANTSMVGTSNCPNCTDDQSAQLVYTTDVCHASLKRDLDRYYIVMLAVGFSLVFITLTAAVVSCEVRVKYHEYQELHGGFYPEERL